MSERGEIDPDWLYEAPFYLMAIITHSALLTLNPVIRWGSAERVMDKVLPIEFVAEIPLPPPLKLTPTPRGNETNAPPHHSPRKYKPKEVKRGGVDTSRKSVPRPKFAREAQAESKRLRAERDRTARYAAELKAAAEAQKRRLAAETRAAKARKRAELSSTLATMSDPDETLEAGEATVPSGRDSAREDGAQLSGAHKAAAASGGSDLLDAKPRGGSAGPRDWTAGPEGGGVSWSVDGPVASRRLLARAAPASPDWVATRNLDLTVTLRFQVLPDGSVAPGAIIQKTSGFPEIDGRALDALRRWRFQSIPAQGGTPEVWGQVTFRFTS